MLDPSMENVQFCNERFHMRMHLGFVKPGRLDLNLIFPDISSRLTLCTGGFGHLPMDKRIEVLGNIRKHLEKGGAFIMVEELVNETIASGGSAMRQIGHIEVGHRAGLLG
jgi:hypothetical protein